MRCLIFCDVTAFGTVDAFNKWAEGKYMTKDVIIHSHVLQCTHISSDAVVIVVFFDENLHPAWVGKQ